MGNLKIGLEYMPQSIPTQEARVLPFISWELHEDRGNA